MQVKTTKFHTESFDYSNIPLQTVYICIIGFFVRQKLKIVALDAMTMKTWLSCFRYAEVA